MSHHVNSHHRTRNPLGSGTLVSSAPASPDTVDLPSVASNSGIADTPSSRSLGIAADMSTPRSSADRLHVAAPRPTNRGGCRPLVRSPGACWRCLTQSPTRMTSRFGATGAFPPLAQLALPRLVVVRMRRPWLETPCHALLGPVGSSLRFFRVRLVVFFPGSLEPVSWSR